LRVTRSIVQTRTLFRRFNEVVDELPASDSDRMAFDAVGRILADAVEAAKYGFAWLALSNAGEAVYVYTKDYLLKDFDEEVRRAMNRIIAAIPYLITVAAVRLHITEIYRL